MGGGVKLIETMSQNMQFFIDGVPKKLHLHCVMQRRHENAFLPCIKISITVTVT